MEKKLNSQRKSKTLFKCSGKCSFKDCCVEFSLQICNTNDANPQPHFLTLLVKFSSKDIKHSTTERQSRPIQKKERQYLWSILKNQSPSTTYNILYSELEKEEFKSGKRDKVGQTRNVIQKISSESNLEEQCHQDLIKSLLILKSNLFCENSSGKISSFIQRIHAFPFSVTCYTEMGVRIYHHTAKTQTLFLDATRSLMSLKKTEYEGSLLYYYSLVIKHSIEKTPPVAVAEFISFCSSIITFFRWLSLSRGNHLWLF